MQLIKVWLISGGLLERKSFLVLVVLAWVVRGLVSIDSSVFSTFIKGSFIFPSYTCAPGDQNNCWDYCFGKEEALSTSLVNIVKNQKFDGVDIDYEYCYDIAGKQSGRCPQRNPTLYSDAKAQTFLSTLTSKLRTKLDALQSSNGYNRGRYIVTHAPMDSDLTPSTSAYFQILKARNADLDFLMPQFYNGVTMPAVDGIAGTGSGVMSAAVMFSSMANELFPSRPNKVRFYPTGDTKYYDVSDNTQLTGHLILSSLTGRVWPLHFWLRWV
jgi:hypothetical protein